MSVHISSVLGNTLKFYFPAKKKGGGARKPPVYIPSLGKRDKRHCSMFLFNLCTFIATKRIVFSL